MIHTLFVGKSTGMFVLRCTAGRGEAEMNKRHGQRAWVW